MNPEARVQSIVAETKRRALKYGYGLSSHKFTSFARGQWVVAAREHPEIAPMKAEYLRLCGVIG